MSAFTREFATAVDKLIAVLDQPGGEDLRVVHEAAEILEVLAHAYYAQEEKDFTAYKWHLTEVWQQLEAFRADAVPLPHEEGDSSPAPSA